MTQHIGPSNIESFKEELEKNIKFVMSHVDDIDDIQDQQFCKQLGNWYDSKGYLTEKQLYYMTKYWIELNEAGIEQE